MKENTLNLTTNLLFPTVLMLVCAGIVFFTLNGRKLPLIDTPRAALIALVVIGMIACTGGIGQVGVSGRWGSPLAILGYLLGATIGMVAISALVGWRFPFIASETQAITAMAVLMGVKYVIGTASYFFHWL